MAPESMCRFRCSTAIREDDCVGKPSCSASAAHVSLQRQVGLDVREASTLFDQARGSRVAWGERIVTPLRTNLADAEKSHSAGESSYLFVLENSRRLIEARLRSANWPPTNNGRRHESNAHRAPSAVPRQESRDEPPPDDGTRAGRASRNRRGPRMGRHPVRSRRRRRSPRRCPNRR